MYKTTTICNTSSRNLRYNIFILAVKDLTGARGTPRASRNIASSRIITKFNKESSKMREGRRRDTLKSTWIMRR